MFVPGVNGSVIPSAPSGSKLKGAYKNSKKRKMRDGGTEDIISTLKELDPNFNKPKNTVNPLVKDALASADKATDILQLGHFSTLPWAQGAALVGDIAGIGVDLAQAGIAGYEGNNSSALGNVGMASVPILDKSVGYERSRSLVRGTSPGNYRPLSALTPAQAVNPAIAKGLAWNKALLASNVAEIASNTNSRTYATQRVPQRDNAQVQFRPNPNMRKMPYGGIKSSIENISPQGDVQYNVSKNLKNFRAGLQGSVNAPGMYAGSVTPTLSYSKNKFSSYVSPNSLGASLEGDKAYLNYNQTREGQTMYRDASAGYNTDKVNLNAGVNFRNNSLESGQISGSYNFNPNLAITGNYGVSQGESGLDKNYFAGLRFNKTFKDGGTLPPIYTSNPRDPRMGRYRDSLNSYNLAPAYNKQILTNLQKASTVKQGFQANLKTNEEFQRKGLNYQLGFNRREVPRQKVSDGFVGAFKYDYKKPVQPYIYKKPEVVPEVIETPVAPAVPVVPVAEPPVKKIGYVKPVIQQFNYMSNENKAKALQKYGSVSDIPFKGVDINQLKNGGEVEDDDDKEMVEGVASILRDVKSKKNRLQLANKLSKQFNREKVEYNLADFLKKSKVKK